MASAPLGVKGLLAEPSGPAGDDEASGSSGPEDEAHSTAPPQLSEASGRALRYCGRASAAALLLGAALAALLVHARGLRRTTREFDAAAVESKQLAPGYPACLCLFDVDRTLTAKQGSQAQCAARGLSVTTVYGVKDPAFGGGILTLSSLGKNIESTFCRACYTGIISAGAVGGPAERNVVQHQLRGLGSGPGFWSTPHLGLRSPLVFGCGDAVKPRCAHAIVQYYYFRQGIAIPPGEVYFFDDHTGNIWGFESYGYNAHQVSCATREGDVGLCGAQPYEVQRRKGISTC